MGKYNDAENRKRAKFFWAHIYPELVKVADTERFDNHVKVYGRTGEWWYYPAAEKLLIWSKDFYGEWTKEWTSLALESVTDFFTHKIK
jgi:hypothetical protein